MGYSNQDDCKRYVLQKAVADQTQQELLRTAKDAVNATWDELAELAGIDPRALKTYRMPKHSKDFRSMPSLARDAILRVVAERDRKVSEQLDMVRSAYHNESYG